MRVAVFDTHRYDRDALERANQAYGFDLVFFEPRLNNQTAQLATGVDAVCSFVNDRLDESTLRVLKQNGVQLIALRSAGYNHVNLAEASRLAIPVARVPRYSPHAVAEHTVALILSLNRKIHRAYTRVREGNFSLEGLIGFNLYGKICGIIGTGAIGEATAKILNGFGCTLLAYDTYPKDSLSQSLNLKYVSLEMLYSQSDIVTLHIPLTPATQHIIDARALALMKPHVMLINTSRGGLIDTKALIQALKCGQVGSAGLDVYEEEEGIFFQDLSDRVLQDDVLARLLTFPNVLVTSHQAFLTNEALSNIADTTMQNIDAFAKGLPLVNEVRAASSPVLEAT